MWKKTLILFTVIAMCYCQGSSRDKGIHIIKKKPHFHHLLYGGGILYYLTFILIKIKIVVVLGTIFTIFVVAGKVFAIFKYLEYLKGKHEPEKIYMQPPYHDSHDDHISFSPPFDSHSSFSSPTVAVEKLPPNAEVFGGHVSYPSSMNSYQPPMNSYPPSYSPGVNVGNSPGNAGGGQYYDSPPPNAYGRSSNNNNNNIDSDRISYYYDLFRATIRNLNITELAFKSMKLKSVECRKKFVCKAEYNSKYSTILSTTLSFVRDEDYDKYRTNATVKSWNDCDRLYENCKNTNI